MSTKTSIKRIAAVAAVALTLGGFTAVTAHAALTNSAVTVLAGPLVGSGNTTAAGTQVVGGVANVTITETSTGTGSAGDLLGTVASTGVGTISGAVPGTAANVTVPTTTYPTSTLNVVAGSGASASTGTVVLSLTSSAAGVQTITFTPISSTGAPGTAVTATITWGAAPAVSAQYSTTQIVAGANGVGAKAYSLTTTSNRYTGSNDTVVGSATANSTSPTAVVGVALASAYDTLISGYLTASISGAGAVAIDTASGSLSTSTTGTTAAQGTAVTTASKDSTFRVSVYANGTAGVGTLTISSGTTVIATKTVTFYSNAVKAVATQNLFVAKAGTVLGAPYADYNSTALTGAAIVGSAGTGTASFTVALTDANGNAASPAQAPIIKSSATSVITVNGCIVLAGVGSYQCSVSGASGAASGATATVTFSIPATSTEVADATTGLFSIKAAPLTFSIGGTLVKEVLTTDASSYAALAPIKLTVTATDSAGNPAYDQDLASGLIASAVSTTQLGGTALSSIVSAATQLINGTASYTGIYAPATAGSFTISGKDVSTAANAISVTASSAGTSSDAASQAAVDAANEATDAANAATDAANNAMDSADAAQQAALDAGDKADAALAAVTDLATKVSAIASQIASLSALVKKIAAKVKA